MTIGVAGNQSDWRSGAGTQPPGTDLTDRECSILALLRQAGPLTRAELIRRSTLSGPAVFRATESLADKGFVKVGESIAAGRGQPSNVIHLNPDAAFSIGIAVMNDSAEAAILDLAGNVRMAADITIPGMPCLPVLEAASNLVRTAINEGLAPNAFVGAGLAIAGFFVGERSQLNPASALDEWALTDIDATASAVFGRPVIVENIASAAAVGESLLGVGRHHSSFAYFNFASGFGGGIILDNQLWRGAAGNAGEFGGVFKAVDAFIPTLESLRIDLANSGVPLADVRALIARYDDDWPGLEPWIARAAVSLKMLALVVHATIDVEAVVLGGRLPKPLALRLAQACSIPQTDLDRNMRRGRARPAPIIRCAEVTEGATTVGAATMPLVRHIFRAGHPGPG